MTSMPLAAVLAFFAVMILVNVALGRILRPMPAIAAWPCAFIGFIALQAMLLNLLSLIHQVTFAGVVAANFGVIMLAGVSLVLGPFRLVRSLPTSWRRAWCGLRQALASPVFLLLAPILIISFHIAFLTAVPNTYDSLTYHMARVAHWMQQQSVAYYPTNISRQNQMSPGAEYAILFFQILSASDRLAVIPQFASYLLLALGLGYLLRVGQVPKKMIPALVLIAMTTPMAVLQSTTTQNDLVCSLAVVVTLIALRPFLHRHPAKVGGGDYALLGMSLAVGYLVKPTSLLFVLPFFGATFVLQWRRLHFFFFDFRRLGGMLFGLVVALAVAGPDIFRKIAHHVQRQEVYPLFAEWDIDRLLNPVRTLGQNLPWPEQTTQILGWFGYHGSVITNNVFMVSQDFIGNPIQILILLSFSLLSVLFAWCSFAEGRRRLSVLLLALCPLAAWCCFALLVRNQLWITRLQLPIFFLSTLSVVYLGMLLRRQRRLFPYVQFGLMALALFSLAYASYAAVHNKTRSLDLAMFWGGRVEPREIGYYNSAPIKDHHDFFIARAAAEKCDRIGLMLGEDSVDYPLTWQLMKLGKKANHVFPGGVDAWPCMIYVAEGGREHVPGQGSQWLSAGDYHTWIRNARFEFDRAGRDCVKIDGSWADHIRPGAEIRTSESAEGLELTSTGNDPAVELSIPSCSASAAAVIHLRMWSSVETVAQIYYVPPDAKGYAERFSQSWEIVPGLNDVYFLLPAEALGRPIRFDPGKLPGKYLLHSIEARSVQNEG